MRTRDTAKLKFRVSDAYGARQADAFVATSKGKVKPRVSLGVRAINVAEG